MKIYFLCLLLQLLEPWIFTHGYHSHNPTFLHRMRRTWLLNSVVDFQLANDFLLPIFLKEYGQLSSIQGVFALSNQESVQYIGSSADVVGAVKEFQDQFGPVATSIRVQTFSSFQHDIVEAYKIELIRQTKPPLNSNNIDFKIDENNDDDNDDDDDMDSLRDLLDISTTSESDEAASISSPFQASTTPAQSPIAITSNDAGLELTIENVNKVLDEVRPYLIADGGNVAVVDIDPKTRDVKLTLQGACGSCPSSTTTMKMGIERVLKENFKNLGSVIAVNDVPPVPVEGQTDSAEQVLKVKVEAALGPVLPAIKGMGGKIEIVKVESSGSVLLKFAGPARLKLGVELVLKEVKEIADFQIIAWDD